MSIERVLHHDRVLGTGVELRIAADAAVVDEIDRLAVGEFARLERAFSVFDEDSELCRWRRGELGDASAEFVELMALAATWSDRSAGAFNPRIGELTALWRRAESSGRVPDDADLRSVAATIAGPAWEMRAGWPVPIDDVSTVNLNAIAKGYIVDRVLAKVLATGAESATINAGGDLAHGGNGSVRVGIENPRRPYDNEPPIAKIEIADSAVATSGVARRGFRVAGRWFGHVIDPRTGWPVDGVASITVVAPNAVTSDVLATVVGVGPPTDLRRAVGRFDGVEALLIDAAGAQHRSSGWDALEVA